MIATATAISRYRRGTWNAAVRHAHWLYANLRSTHQHSGYVCQPLRSTRDRHWRNTRSAIGLLLYQARVSIEVWSSNSPQQGLHFFVAAGCERYKRAEDEAQCLLRASSFLSSPLLCDSQLTGMAFKALLSIVSIVAALQGASGMYSPLPIRLTALNLLFCPAALTKRVACPDGKNTATNAACCALFPLREEIMNDLFHNQCAEEAHESFRLTFHDAIAFSPEMQARGQFGYACLSESLVKNLLTTTSAVVVPMVPSSPSPRPKRPSTRMAVSTTSLPSRSPYSLATTSLRQTCACCAHLASYIKHANIRYSIQFAGSLALSTCPGAPRVDFLLGRKDGTRVAPNGLVPEPFGEQPLSIALDLHL